MCICVCSVRRVGGGVYMCVCSVWCVGGGMKGTRAVDRRQERERKIWVGERE